MMRNWRAGSITLGVMLVAFGVSMLAGKIWTSFTILDVVIWWPVVFILLGCEILASLFLSSDKPLKVKFDGGSIFLIGIVLVFAMGLSVVSYAVGQLPNGIDTLDSAIVKNLN